MLYFRCGQCPFQSFNDDVLVNHVQENHDQDTTKDSSNDFEGEQELSNKDIVSARDVKNEILCTVCSYKSKDKYNFNRHLETHKLKQCPTKENLNNYEYPQHNKVRQHLICKECNEVFPSKSSRRQHFDLSHRTNRFYCKHCDYKTGLKSKYSYHMRKDHSGKRYHCVICEKKTITMGNMKDHFRIHHSGQELNVIKPSTHKAAEVPDNLRCEDCDFTFSSAESYKSHKKRMHSGSYKCSKCEEQFETKTNLRQHLAIGHVDVLYKCRFCDYITGDDRKLRNHKIKDHEKQVFYCGECNHRTHAKKFLKNHYRNKHNKELGEFKFEQESHVTNYAILQCPSCGYETENHSDLRKHKSIHPTSVRHKYICQECGRDFLSKDGFRNHQDSIHYKKTYKCSKCKYLARTEARLRYHADKKHKDEAYQCNICNNKLATKQHLRTHIKVVHSEPKFVCETCDFKSKTKNGLKWHVEGVHEKKRYRCKFDECSISYALKVKITKHMKEDHNEDLSCTLCDYKTTNKTILKDHIDGFHKGLNFSCNLCKFTSTSKAKLSYHQGKFHSAKLQACHLCDYKSFNAGHMKVHIRRMHEQESKMSIFKREEREKYKIIPLTENQNALEIVENSLAKKEEVKVTPKDDPKCTDNSIIEEESKPSTLSFIKDPKVNCFKCNSCDYNTHNSKNLRQHNWNIHKTRIEDNANCNYCGKQFSNRALRNDHIEMKHKIQENKRICIPCGFSTYVPIRMENHKRNVHKEKVHCGYCDEVFIHYKQLSKHVEKSHESYYKEFNEKLKADIADRTEKRNLQRKIEASRKPETFICADCGKEFKSKAYLKYHIDAFHNSALKYFCKRCDFKTTSKWKNRYHELKFHNKESFLCNLCNYVTVIKVHLKVHMEHKHAISK